MKELLKLLKKKPSLYEQSPQNMWDDEHISKGMLEAHLNQSIESATRKMEDVKKSVEWIVSILPPSQYPSLLDLGCGPGIYAELFYQARYHVTGIDISARSITYAQTSAQNKQMKIRYLQADYTQIPLPCNHDIITLIYCDFGVLPTTVRNQLLQNIYHSLHPQGVLLFDVFTKTKYQNSKEYKAWESHKGGFWDEQPHIELHRFSHYEEDCTFLNQHIILTEDKMTYYNIWEHTFTFDELKKDLIRAGFQQVNFYGNVVGKSCSKNDLTICVIAYK